MPLKVVLFYNQSNRGWTETFFAPQDNPPGHVEGIWTRIVKAAIRFRHPLTSLYGIRFSMLSGAKKSIFFPLSTKYKPDTGFNQSTPDLVGADGVWQLRGQDYSKRAISLRGLYENAVERLQDGTDKPSAELIKAVDLYLDTLAENSMAIRVASTPNNSALISYDPERADFDPLNLAWVRIWYKTLGGPGFAVGDAVRFSSKFKFFMPGFPSVAKVRSITVDPPYTKYSFDYTYRPSGSTNLVNCHTILAQYQYKTITDWDFQRLSTRDTGRPFGSLRGRSRTAVARH